MTDDPMTVEVFCRRFVEPMGEESDHVHIVALTDALQVSILQSMGTQAESRVLGSLVRHRLHPASRVWLICATRTSSPSTSSHIVALWLGEGE